MDDEEYAAAGLSLYSGNMIRGTVEPSSKSVLTNHSQQLLIAIFPFMSIQE